MGCYIGPVCRLCRREGEKLFLKGDKCLTKCTLETRKGPPGQHGAPRRGRRPTGGGNRMTEYGKRLREKQKARRFYGVMEKQFRRYYQMARRMKGVLGEDLLQLLERRLDNVVYRMGFAHSRRHARQITGHRHIAVNGKTVNIPSYLVSPGDVIEVREGSRNNPDIREAVDASGHFGLPSWLERDEATLRGRVPVLPTRDQIDANIEEQLVVEFYSR